ncbi:MAG: endonuclease/exonuclease/phosphatase family protein [Planctomycetota bacterium]|jgi:hypothetical protein|nr:endonuclease/exonuclease/phosphatase family protein [Planctomycetota bacterium]
MMRPTLLFALLWATPVLANDVIMDGRFDDWSSSEANVTDPTGDASDKFDVVRLSAKTNKKYLYLRLELNHELNLQSGDKADGNLILNLENSNGKIEINLRSRLATLMIRNAKPRRLSWKEIGFTALPTYASRTHELRIAPSAIGFGPRTPVQVNVRGSDVIQPLKVRWSGKELPKSVLKLNREKGSFRVANLNTLRQGLADSKRRQPIKKLLELSEADVLTFQEEWKEDLFLKNVGKVFGSTTESKPLNVHWNNGCAIATHLKLTPLKLNLERGAAGYIETNDGKSVIVVSVHFKCCGYAGSPEDQQRLRTAKQLAQLLEDFNQTLPTPLPMVVIGDYNLVGSRRPLTCLEENGFQELVCLDESLTAATWRGLRESESFWPGRLDIVVSKGLTQLRGQIFNPSLNRVPDQDLNSASDHLMVISDFLMK